MNVDFKASATRPLDVVMENAIRTAAALENFPTDRRKKQKTPTYNFTLEQIEAMMAKAKEEAVRDAVNALIELMLGLPTMIHHDKHGWGKKRCSQFVDDVMNLYDSYEKGYITLEDVREALWEEADTRVQRVDKSVTWKGDKR